MTLVDHCNEVQAFGMIGDDPKDLPIAIYHTLPIEEELSDGTPPRLRAPAQHGIRILFYSDGGFLAEYTWEAAAAHNGQEYPCVWYPSQAADLVSILTGSRNE